VQSSFNFTRLFLKSTLATSVLLAMPVQGSDWNISAPVDLTSNDPRRIVVGSDLNSGSETPVLSINARSGGIKVDTGILVSTSASAGASSSPEKATIFINSNGLLDGMLQNQGHVRNGVVITGKSSNTSGSAYFSQGQDATHQASMQGKESLK
jgi:hypothetical protein